MWQHMKSFANQLLLKDYPVRFIISPGFCWMNEFSPSITNYSFPSNAIFPKLRNILSLLWFNHSNYRHIFHVNPPSGILLASWHPLNFLLVRMVKSLNPNTPVIVWLHEPFKDDKKIYGAKAIIIYLVELFQTLSLRYIDVVVLHSRRGLRLFERRYPNFQGLKRMVPLQFQDDGLDVTAARRYISFLLDYAPGIDGN